MSHVKGSPVQTLGQALEGRILSELETKPLPQYADLLDLKNLAGDSTGYVKAFGGNKIEKGSSVSIEIMPGVRYFNIHIIPEAQYDIPRFIAEGILMPNGSQVSMDLFPDRDIVTQIDAYLEKYSRVAEIYEEARLDDRFTLEPSRLVHMRAFCSPVFLLVNRLPEKYLAVLESYAERYFDAWKTMYLKASRLSDDEAAARRQLRENIGKTIMRLDPDRHMVVQVYGEETTQMIEQANMY